jgi:hypothetical protein
MEGKQTMTMIATRRPNYTRDAMPDDPPPPLETFVAPISAELDRLIRVTPQIGNSDLRELIKTIHSLYELCARLNHESLAAELQCKLESIELQIANIFGAKRGWQLSQKPFRWTALIGGMEIDNSPIYDLPPYSDHPIFYCDLDGMPAAILAQEYNFNDAKRNECEQFALMTGIVFELPDFQSWHSPGTTLVLWRVKN